jgi:hypothetical protein
MPGGGARAGRSPRCAGSLEQSGPGLKAKIPPDDGGSSRRTHRPTHVPSAALPWGNPHAAGVDIGREESWACGPDDRDAQPVRPFGTCTPDLDALADWLATCRREPVAMESPGV